MVRFGRDRRDDQERQAGRDARQQGAADAAASRVARHSQMSRAWSR